MYGSLCKHHNKTRNSPKNPLVDFYLKNDTLNDPLITIDRIKILGIVEDQDLKEITNLTLKLINY